MRDGRGDRRPRASPRRTLVHIRVGSEEELARLIELENRLDESGLEIETGFLLEEGIREWNLEAGREETEQALRALRQAGFKPKVLKERAPRPGRLKYSEGDVFRIPLADGRFAYGRVLAIEPPGPPFIEIYPIARSTDPSMEELARSDWLFRIYCAGDALAEGRWTIVGRLPLAGPIQKPLFWDDSPFDGKFYLREDPVSTIGQRETTPEEIVRLRAQPAVLDVPRGVEAVLNAVLVQGKKHYWLHPELSENPARKRPPSAP